MERPPSHAAAPDRAAAQEKKPTATSDQIETVAGDYWTIKQYDEDWPIVICDDEMVEEFFKAKKRPSNARQADGTWLRDYKIDGDRVDRRAFPALALGSMQE